MKGYLANPVKIARFYKYFLKQAGFKAWYPLFYKLQFLLNVRGFDAAYYINVFYCLGDFLTQLQKILSTVLCKKNFLVGSHRDLSIKVGKIPISTHDRRESWLFFRAEQLSMGKWRSGWVQDVQELHLTREDKKRPISRRAAKKAAAETISGRE